MYVRFNVWMLRRPWALALLVGLELWAVYVRTSPWRVLMLAMSVFWLVASFVNNATRGRIERQFWPNIW